MHAAYYRCYTANCAIGRRQILSVYLTHRWSTIIGQCIIHERTVADSVERVDEDNYPEIF